MKKFNYKEYIADNWLLKEADSSLKRPTRQATSSDLKGFATKDATLKRQDRVSRGNWKDSLGKFVETHGDDINAALKSRQLRNYVETKMKPALGPEAQQYLDGLLQSCRFDSKLLQALYNVSLKGSGLGLHEESEVNKESTLFSLPIEQAIQKVEDDENGEYDYMDWGAVAEEWGIPSEMGDGARDEIQAGLEDGSYRKYKTLDDWFEELFKDPMWWDSDDPHWLSSDDDLDYPAFG